MSFLDLGIEPDIVYQLKKQGITEPFEVQEAAIPDTLLGKDICCRAPTGSGKTLAFGLPLARSCSYALTCGARPSTNVQKLLTIPLDLMHLGKKNYYYLYFKQKEYLKQLKFGGIIVRLCLQIN